MCGCVNACHSIWFGRLPSIEWRDKFNGKTWKLRGSTIMQLLRFFFSFPSTSTPSSLSWAFTFLVCNDIFRFLLRQSTKSQPRWAHREQRTQIQIYWTETHPRTHSRVLFHIYTYLKRTLFCRFSFFLGFVSRLLLRMAQTVLMYGHIIFLMRFPRHQVALANRLPQYKYFVMFFASFFLLLLLCNKSAEEEKTNSRCSQSTHIVEANT